MIALRLFQHKNNKKKKLNDFQATSKNLGDSLNPLSKKVKVTSSNGLEK